MKTPTRAGITATLVAAVILVPVGWLTSPWIDAGLLTASYRWGEPANLAQELVPDGFTATGPVRVGTQMGFPVRYPTGSWVRAIDDAAWTSDTITAAEVLASAGYDVTSRQQPGVAGSSAAGSSGDFFAHVTVRPVDESDDLDAAETVADIKVRWPGGQSPFGYAWIIIAAGGAALIGVAAAVRARGRIQRPGEAHLEM